MARDVRKKVLKGISHTGPGNPEPPKKKRPGSGDPDDLLTVAKIILEYGGSRAQWESLIRSGKLRGTKSPGRSEYVVRTSQLRAYVARAVVRTLNADAPPLPKRVLKAGAAPLPKIVVRNGSAYLAGTSVPVRRLERARRSGSTSADLKAAFPDLPPRAMDAVAAYVRHHPKPVKTRAEELAPAEVTPGDEDDDGAGFDESLESLLESDAELFRRLAQ